MISPVDRSKAVELIEEAIQSGATLDAACKEVGISSRTLNRWKKSAAVDGDYIDHRTTCERKPPSNKLTEFEEHQILNIVHNPKYSSLPPSQIVPMLADEGIYIA